MESNGETVFGILVTAGILVVGISGNGRVVVVVGRRNMWKRIRDNWNIITTIH